MKNFTSKRFALGLAMMLMAGLPTAKATLIDYTFSTPATLTDYSQQISVPTFDLTLGVLQKVEILNANSNFSSAVSVTNGGANPVSGKGFGSFDFTFSLSDANHLIDMSQTGSAAIGLISFTNLASHATANLGSVTIALALPNQAFTDAATLNAFSSVGGGSILITESTLTDALLGVQGAQMSVSSLSLANAGLTVRYSYDASVQAPEPSSFIALGALLGASTLTQFIRRRRKA